MGYVIERASEKDLTTLAVYAEPIIRETGMRQIASYDAASIYDTLLTMHGDVDSVLLVVKRGGEIVGVLGGTLTEPYWNRNGQVAHHMFWWVHPEHRKSGLGMRLVREFEAWASTAGAKGVTFSIPANALTQRVLPEYRPLEMRLIRRLSDG